MAWSKPCGLPPRRRAKRKSRWLLAAPGSASVHPRGPVIWPYQNPPPFALYVRVAGEDPQRGRGRPDPCRGLLGVLCGTGVALLAGAGPVEGVSHHVLAVAAQVAEQRRHVLGPSLVVDLTPAALALPVRGPGLQAALELQATGPIDDRVGLVELLAPAGGPLLVGRAARRNSWEAQCCGAYRVAVISRRPTSSSVRVNRWP